MLIATLIDYGPKTNHVNTSSVEAVIKCAKAINPNVVMVIKSTIPVGYTASIKQELGCDDILFLPELSGGYLSLNHKIWVG